jgi:hypothetical protein
MKFESLILASLFAVCFAVCALVVGAMLTTTPNSVQLAHANEAAVVVAIAPAS